MQIRVSPKVGNLFLEPLWIHQVISVHPGDIGGPAHFDPMIQGSDKASARVLFNLYPRVGELLTEDAFCSIRRTIIQNGQFIISEGLLKAALNGPHNRGDAIMDRQQDGNPGGHVSAYR